MAKYCVYKEKKLLKPDFIRLSFKMLSPVSNFSFSSNVNAIN